MSRLLGKKKRFAAYSLYAWGSPLIISAIGRYLLYVHTVVDIRRQTDRQKVKTVEEEKKSKERKKTPDTNIPIIHTTYKYITS